MPVECTPHSFCMQHPSSLCIVILVSVAKAESQRMLLPAAIFHLTHAFVHRSMSGCRRTKQTVAMATQLSRRCSGQRSRCAQLATATAAATVLQAAAGMRRQCWAS